MYSHQLCRVFAMCDDMKSDYQLMSYHVYMHYIKYPPGLHQDPTH